MRRKGRIERVEKKAKRKEDCRGVEGCLKKVYYAENDGFFLCGCVCNLEKPNQKIHERQSIAEVQEQNKSNSSMD